MRTDILEDIKKRLVSEFKFKAKGEWLQQGKCPSCSAKELYTHGETPWVIKCGRMNKCGYERHAKDLYPELLSGKAARVVSSGKILAPQRRQRHGDSAFRY